MEEGEVFLLRGRRDLQAVEAQKALENNQGSPLVPIDEGVREDVSRFGKGRFEERLVTDSIGTAMFRELPRMGSYSASSPGRERRSRSSNVFGCSVGG